FEAFPVRHSIRAPAVGYRVSDGNSSFFYLTDVAEFPNASAALLGLDLYIGDGASMGRSMVRKKNGIAIGHAPITFQLGWCEKARVRLAIFTHCGSQIVRGKPRQVEDVVRRLGLERGVEARVACDGLKLSIAPGGTLVSLSQALLLAGSNASRWAPFIRGVHPTPSRIPGEEASNAQSNRTPIETLHYSTFERRLQ
ncbi:MAG: MBL fold metallo-hydrolase, partial [Xanthobacteraceae bacterium]